MASRIGSNLPPNTAAINYPQDPVPRCPPGIPVPPGVLQYKKYAAELRKMSDTQLNAEQKKQEQRLWIAEHGIRYDPVVAADAKAKLKLIAAEKGRRALGSGPAELKKYAQDVKKLSNPELLKEIGKQRMALWAATHGIRYDPKAEAEARQKLIICLSEAKRRHLPVPLDTANPLPWPGVR